MNRTQDLAGLLRHIYGEHSRFDVGPPSRIMKDLERGVLVLSDIEISDDDVPLLLKFLSHPMPIKIIKRIQVEKTSSKKVHIRRNDSAFLANNAKLFKGLCQFIASASSLQCLTFESVTIPIEGVAYLGKSLASSPSAISWLGFRQCSIGSDAGLCVLAHYVGQMKVQVLAFEQCALTDKSLKYISSLIRAQQNHLDSLYWNSTLRVDPKDRHELWSNPEINSVFRTGLVSISLCGNLFELSDVFELTRVLRANQWLLGINLAHNNIGNEKISIFIEEIMNNTVLQSVLLGGNPGFIRHHAAIVHQLLRRNEVLPADTDSNEEITFRFDGGTEMSRDEIRRSGVSGLQGAGAWRLKQQVPRIAQLLHLWQELQKVEYVETATVQSANNVNEISFASKPLPPSASRRPPLEIIAANGRVTQLKSLQRKEASAIAVTVEPTNAFGYSVLDMVRDDSVPALHKVDVKRGRIDPLASLSSFVVPKIHKDSEVSPHTNKASPYSFNRSTISTSQFVSNVARSTPPRSPSNKGARLGRSFSDRDLKALVTKLNDHDAGQTVFDDASEIPPSRSSIKDRNDVLELAIPSMSPHRPQGTSSSNAQESLRELVEAQQRQHYRERHSPEGDETEEEEVDSASAPVRAEGWGAVEWPVGADGDAPNRSASSDVERPPSRVSMRPIHVHRNDSINQMPSGSPHSQLGFLQPTQAQSNEFYRTMYDQTFPPTSHSPSATRSVGRASSASHTRTSKPPNTSRLDSSMNFSVQRPFYTGSTSPTRRAENRTATSVDRGKILQWFNNESKSHYMSLSSSVAKPPPAKKKLTRKSTSAEPSHRREPTSKVTLGKASHPHGTRMRQARVNIAHQRKDDGRKSQIDPVQGESLQFLNSLSHAVLSATRNLEQVSHNLRDAMDSLSNSMEINNSMHSMSTAGGGLSGFHEGHSFRSERTAESRLQHSAPLFKEEQFVVSSASPSRPSNRYGDIRSNSPVTSFPVHIPTGGVSNGKSSPLSREATSGIAAVAVEEDSVDSESKLEQNGNHDFEDEDSAGEDDDELVELIRERMENKIRSMLDAESS